MNAIVLQKLPLKRTIKNDKKVSLKKLLLSFGGEQWFDDPDLQWLIPILEPEAENVEVEQEEGDCNCLEDDVGNRF